MDKNSRIRQLTLVSPSDSARLALRFPLTAFHIIRDCTNGRPTSYPRRLGLFLTNRCDSLCSMCAVKEARIQAPGSDMPFRFVESVLAEASPYQPVVDLIGGEPLLYPHLIEAVNLSTRRNVLAVVTTNGHKLEQKAEALVRAELPVLQVSLDGWDAPSQEARGHVKRSFQQLCAGIRAVREAKGNRSFPIIRILTAITRVNHAHLDRIQSVVADLGLRYWGISNYFYVNREVYLTKEQVQALKSSLQRVRKLNRKLGLRIAYAWNIDVDAYYSPQQPSRASLCDLPFTRLDIHTDGRMALCVTGKKFGQVGQDSIAAVWNSGRLRDYREQYERSRPMPTCFRCCGLSQTIKFDQTAQFGD